VEAETPTSARRTVIVAALIGEARSATVRESLAVAPGLNSVRIAAVRLSPADVYGRSHLECLVAATFFRKALDGVDWGHPDSPTIFDHSGRRPPRAVKRTRCADIKHV
jgi:hypothetical protein